MKRMRAPITLDLHLPNFNYPDTAPEAVFERQVVLTQARKSSRSVMPQQAPGPTFARLVTTGA